MVATQNDALKAFSQFHAVVLNHRMGSGRRVRWSPSHSGWVRAADYPRTEADTWLSEPGESLGRSDAPYEDEVSSAISLAQSVLHAERNFYCERCFQNDAQGHFIAPNVHGQPELYCVQVPAYSVVDSGGGCGRLKHWGSPFGCQSVEHHISLGEYSHGNRTGPAAAYVFGLPLPANEVINRQWCSRCVRAASNVRNNAVSSGADEVEWARERTRSHVSLLSRTLPEYYGDPSGHQT